VFEFSACLLWAHRLTTEKYKSAIVFDMKGNDVLKKLLTCQGNALTSFAHLDKKKLTKIKFLRHSMTIEKVEEKKMITLMIITIFVTYVSLPFFLCCNKSNM